MATTILDIINILISQLRDDCRLDAQYATARDQQWFERVGEYRVFVLDGVTGACPRGLELDFNVNVINAQFRVRGFGRAAGIKTDIATEATWTEAWTKIETMLAPVREWVKACYFETDRMMSNAQPSV